MASATGELSAVYYMCNRDKIDKEVKDNALMTPLMNTVSSNHPEAFIYLHFN